MKLSEFLSLKRFPLTEKAREKMAKAAKKSARKKVAKKATRRKGSAKARVGKVVKTEPTAPLPGFEDIDERVDAIDAVLEKIQAAEAKISEAKKSLKKLTDSLLPLMKEHSLESYKTAIGTVCVLHGEDVVVIQKTKKTKKSK